MARLDSRRRGLQERARSRNGTPPAKAWIPGLVEVQFESDAPVQAVEAATGRPRLASPAARLDDFHSVLDTLACESVIPTFRAKSRDADRAARIARGDGEAIPDLRDFVRLQFPRDADVEQIAARLDQLPIIVRAAPVSEKRPPTETPPRPRRVVSNPVAPGPHPNREPLFTLGELATDPSTRLESQWYLARCGATNAWKRRAMGGNRVSPWATGEGVVIADIDWGYRVSHEELAPRLDLTMAYNSFDGGTNVSYGSATYHGTAVLGLAGADVNGRGMAGIAYRSTLWPIQANDGPGPKLPGDEWANAIEWVRTADSGGRRKVIILQVQTGSGRNIEMEPAINAAIRAAIADGVVVCIAAGNGDLDAGVDDFGNPIPNTGAIMVGATEYHPTLNRRASVSNYGPRVDVCAPGDEFHDVTCSSLSDDAYTNEFGATSGAAAKVAAAAALLLELDPTLTPATVRALLIANGKFVSEDPSKPIGRLLDCGTAVAALPRSRYVRDARKEMRFRTGKVLSNPSIPYEAELTFNTDHRLLVGIGLGMSSGRVTTLRIHGRRLNPSTGTLGEKQTVSDGSAPSHAAERIIGTPDSDHIFTGVGVNAQPGNITTLRLWTRDVLLSGSLGRLREWRLGRSPNGALDAQAILPVGFAAVGVEMRANPGDISQLYVRTGQLRNNARD